MSNWPVHGTHHRPDRHDRLRLDRPGHAAADRASFRLRQEPRSRCIDPSDADRAPPRRARHPLHPGSASRADNYRELLTPLLTEGGGQGFCVNLSVDTSLARHHGALPRARRALHRHRRRALGRLLLRQQPGPGGAHQLRPARERCSTARRRSPAARRRCPAAAPIPAWCRGSSSRRCSTSRPTSASTHDEPKTREDWARLMQPGSASRASTSPSATRSAPRIPKPMQRLRQHLVGRGLRLARACSRPNSAGARTRPGCRTTAARTRPAAARRSTCCSPAPIPACAPGRRPRRPQYGFLVTHNESISIADYFTVREGGKVVYRPTCHYAYHPATTRCCRCTRCSARPDACRSEHHILDETRDRRRHRRARRPALRPRQERLLVRLAALDRGDAPHRALPERHRPAGDLRGARRHGLGAGEPAGRHRRGRRDRLPPLPRGADALSRPGRRRLHRLDPARPTAPGFFPEDIDPSDPWQFRNVLVR